MALIIHPEEIDQQFFQITLVSASGRRAPKPITASLDILLVAVCVCVCVSYSFMSDSVTPWTVAHRAPLSMEFSRQEYWNG